MRRAGRRTLVLAGVVASLGIGVVAYVRGDSDDRVTSTAELLASLNGLESQNRVRELLGEPSRIERRPHADVWDYYAPFQGVTHIRLALGERKRLAWHSVSGTDVGLRP